MSAVLSGACLDESYKKLSLVAKKLNAMIVTQNIDGLHKINESGEHIFELFGNYNDPDNIVLLGGNYSDDIKELFRNLRNGAHDYCLVIGSKLEIVQSADIVRCCGKYDVVDRNIENNVYHIDGIEVQLQTEFECFVTRLYSEICPGENVLIEENNRPDVGKSNYCDLSDLKVISFTGKSGTGKSHIALRIAEIHGIEAIIDDGLLLYLGRVQAGESAKVYLKGNDKSISAARNAMFIDEANPYGKNSVRSAIELGYRSGLITGVMIIGTSAGSVEKIREKLKLPQMSAIIKIEDVTTVEEREVAQQSRCKKTGHALPGAIN